MNNRAPLRIPFRASTAICTLTPRPLKPEARRTAYPISTPGMRVRAAPPPSLAFASFVNKQADREPPSFFGRYIRVCASYSSFFIEAPQKWDATSRFTPWSFLKRWFDETRPYVLVVRPPRLGPSSRSCTSSPA